MRHFVNIISSLKRKERVGTEKPLRQMCLFLETAVAVISHLDVHILWQTKDLKGKKKNQPKTTNQTTNYCAVRQISKLKPITIIKINTTTMEYNQKV